MAVNTLESFDEVTANKHAVLAEKASAFHAITQPFEKNIADQIMAKSAVVAQVSGLRENIANSVLNGKGGEVSAKNEIVSNAANIKPSAVALSQKQALESAKEEQERAEIAAKNNAKQNGI